MVPLVRGRCKMVLVPLTRRKSSHALERLAMTGPIDPSHVTRLVDSARRSLEQTGEPGHDVRLVGPPVVTARSRLYLLGRVPPTADYVLKEPLAGDAAVDTDPPLSARAQSEALELASAWQGTGSAVSRPVALLEDYQRDMRRLLVESAHRLAGPS